MSEKLREATVAFEDHTIRKENSSHGLCTWKIWCMTPNKDMPADQRREDLSPTGFIPYDEARFEAKKATLTHENVILSGSETIDPKSI